MNFVFRPVGLWPGEETPPDSRRSRWSFKAGYNDTMNRLRYELGELLPRGHYDESPVVIQIALRERDIRLDGLPRADAPRPAHPGVVIAFESIYGPLKYATDTFELWEHNLRAIALGLEALRKVDRYGITRRGEQYAGWKALPPGGPSPDRGRRIVEERGGMRQALFGTHPDHGGDALDFADVQAYKQLEETNR